MAAVPVGPSVTTTNDWGEKVTTTHLSDGTLQIVTQHGGDEGAHKPTTTTQIVIDPAWASVFRKPEDQGKPLPEPYKPKPKLTPTQQAILGLDEDGNPSTGSNVPPTTMNPYDPSGLLGIQLDSTGHPIVPESTKPTATKPVGLTQDIDPARGILPSIPKDLPKGQSYYVRGPNGALWKVTNEGALIGRDGLTGAWDAPGGLTSPDTLDPRNSAVTHPAQGQRWELLDEKGKTLQEVDVVVLANGLPYRATTTYRGDVERNIEITTFNSAGVPSGYQQEGLTGPYNDRPASSGLITQLGTAAITGTVADRNTWPLLGGAQGIAAIGSDVLTVGKHAPGDTWFNNGDKITIDPKTNGLIIVRPDGLVIQTSTGMPGPGGIRDTTTTIQPPGQNPYVTDTVNMAIGNASDRNITYAPGQKDPVSITQGNANSGWLNAVYSQDTDANGKAIPGQWVHTDDRGIKYQIDTRSNTETITTHVNNSPWWAPHSDEYTETTTIRPDGSIVVDRPENAFESRRVTYFPDGTARTDYLKMGVVVQSQDSAPEDQTLNKVMNVVNTVGTALIPNLPHDFSVLANNNAGVMETILASVDVAVTISIVGGLGRASFGVLQAEGRAAAMETLTRGGTQAQAEENAIKAVQAAAEKQRGITPGATTPKGVDPKPEGGTGNGARTQPEGTTTPNGSGQQAVGTGAGHSGQGLPAEPAVPGVPVESGTPGIANTPGIETPRIPSESAPWDGPGLQPGDLPSTSPLSPALQELDRALGIDATAIVDTYVAEQMARLDAVLVGVETREPALAGAFNNIRNGIRAEAERLGLGGAEARTAGAEARAAGGAAREGGLGTPSGGGGRAGGGDGAGGGGRGPGDRGPTDPPPRDGDLGGGVPEDRPGIIYKYNSEEGLWYGYDLNEVPHALPKGVQPVGESGQWWRGPLADGGKGFVTKPDWAVVGRRPRRYKGEEYTTRAEQVREATPIPPGGSPHMQRIGENGAEARTLPGADELKSQARRFIGEGLDRAAVEVENVERVNAGRQELTIISEQASLDVAIGGGKTVKINPDFIVFDPETRTAKIIDSKFGKGAGYTDNQLDAYPVLARGNLRLSDLNLSPTMKARLAEKGIDENTLISQVETHAWNTEIAPDSAVLARATEDLAGTAAALEAGGGEVGESATQALAFLREWSKEAGGKPPGQTPLSLPGGLGKGLFEPTALPIASPLTPTLPAPQSIDPGSWITGIVGNAVSTLDRLTSVLSSTFAPTQPINPPISHPENVDRSTTIAISVMDVVRPADSDIQKSRSYLALGRRA